MTDVRMANGMETSDDQRAAPASQEDENHQSGKRGGDNSLTNHPIDCSAHEDGLIGKGLNLELQEEGFERFLEAAAAHL